MSIISNGMLTAADTARAKALAGGPLVVATPGGRYVLTPTLTAGGEFFWSVTDRDGFEHRFTGNTRAAARKNFLSWLAN